MLNVKADKGNNRIKQHMFHKTTSQNKLHVPQRNSFQKRVPLNNFVRTAMWLQQIVHNDRLYGGLEQLSATAQSITHNKNKT